MNNGLFGRLANFPIPDLPRSCAKTGVFELAASSRREHLFQNERRDDPEWNVRAAEFLCDLGSYDESISFATQVRKLASKTFSPVLLARALSAEAVSFLCLGRTRDAALVLAKLELISETSTDPYILGLYHFTKGYGIVYSYEGEDLTFERAGAELELSIQCFESAGSIERLVLAKIEFADVLSGKANYAGAVKTCLDALELCANHNEWRYVGRLLAIAASAATDQGYREGVEATLRKSIEWSEFLGDRWGEVQGYFALGRLFGYEMPSLDPTATQKPEKVLRKALKLAVQHQMLRRQQTLKHFLAWVFAKAGEEGKRQEWIRQSELDTTGNAFVEALRRDSDMQMQASNRHVMSELEGAIQQNPDAFFLFVAIRDDEKCIDFLNEYRNEAANRILDKEPTAFCTFSDVRSNLFLENLDLALLRAIEDRSSFEDQIDVCLQAGNPRCFSRHIFPSEEGAVLTIRDITEAHQIQEALLQVAEKAQASERAKSEYLANMSHEVRTPLNGILGLARLLFDTPLDEYQQAYVQDIIGSGNILLAVIGDILDLSKIEASCMQIEEKPVDLVDLVKQTVNLYLGQASEKGVVLSYGVEGELPKYVMADAARLRQILGNLVGNAVKFTEDGAVDVGIVAQAGQVSIFVRDTGPGIPPDRLEAVFERYHQEPSSQGGTGLGLTISKRLAELMGGKLWVESELGAGSRFILQLTVVEADSPPDLGPTPESARFDGTRVLLVEDNRVNAIVSTRLLERFGCQVSLAVNGLEALGILARESFDLVLMDVRMPIMSGLEATEKWRAQEAEGHLTIVALTAGASLEERNECIESGMDDHLTKPFTPESLLGVLARWLDARRLSAA